MHKGHKETKEQGRPGFSSSWRCLVRVIGSFSSCPVNPFFVTFVKQAKPLGYFDAIKYNFIGRIESFAQDFEQVLRRLNASAELIAAIPETVNPTTKMYHAAAYDRELAGRVYDMYQEDFKNFGYDRDSWLFDY